MTDRSWNYDRTEMTVDAVVHVGGLALAAIGAVAMIAVAILIADAWSVAVAGVYLATLVLALAASATYSMWPVTPTKWLLRKYDHAAIYLLIAGTYTPFAMALGESGRWLLAFVWTVAILGASLKFVLPERYQKLSIVLYLGLAWSGIVMIEALLDALPTHIFWLLLAGGVVYSAGVVFHLWSGLRFHKAIWHIFVLAAAIIHYNAIFLLIANTAS